MREGARSVLAEVGDDLSLLGRLFRVYFTCDRRLRSSLISVLLGLSDYPPRSCSDNSFIYMLLCLEIRTPYELLQSSRIICCRSLVVTMQALRLLHRQKRQNRLYGKLSVHLSQT